MLPKILPWLFITVIFFFPVSGKEYEDDFFSSAAKDKWYTLSKYGTWIKECNASPYKVLLQFPTKEAPSVCASLEHLGFSEQPDGICSRSPLVCNKTRDKIEWTSSRKRDHFTIDFDSDVIWLETILFSNGSITVKLDSRDVVIARLILKEFLFMVPGQSHRECFISSEFQQYDFGFIQTKSGIYQCVHLYHGKLNKCLKLNLTKAKRVEIVQDGASLSMIQMNHSRSQSITKHPNQLDSLHRISNELKNRNIWSCDMFKDCHDDLIPTSGQLNLKNTLTPKTNIYFSIHLDSELILTIVQGDGQSHAFQFLKTETKIRVIGPDQVVGDMLTEVSNLEVVLVVQQQSITMLFTDEFEAMLVYEFVIDKLVMEHIQELQIEPSDHQTTKMILISPSIEPKAIILDLQPVTSFFSSPLLYYTLITLVIGIISIILLIGVFLLGRRQRSGSEKNRAQNSTTNSIDSHYEDPQYCVRFNAQEEETNREDYYETSNLDYYT